MIKFETKNGEIKNASTFTNTFPVIKESNNYKYSHNYIYIYITVQSKNYGVHVNVINQLMIFS